MKTILRYCDLPDDDATVDRAKQSLAHDSQVGTPLCSAVLNKHRTIEYSGATKDEFDSIFKKYSIPVVDYIAPGTITYRGESTAV